MYELGLHQLVQGPTHRAGHTLDLCFVNEENLSKGVEFNNIVPSDHLGILVSLDIPIRKCKSSWDSPKVRLRQWARFDRTAFNAGIREKLDLRYSKKMSVHEKACVVENCIIETLDEQIPEVEKKIKNRVFFNPGLQDEIRERRKLERKWNNMFLRYPDAPETEIVREQYMNQCKLTNDRYHEARTVFYREKLSRSGLKEMFRTSQDLLSDKTCKERKLPLGLGNSKDLSDSFNNYFCEKIDKIRTELEPLKKATYRVLDVRILLTGNFNH